MATRERCVSGIHRTKLLALVATMTFGSFNVYKALGGGSATAASVSGKALAAGSNHERHEKKTSDSSAATLSCLSSVSWSPTSASSPVKTDLTPIEQIQVGERVLAESPTGDKDLQFGSDIIPADRLTKIALGARAVRGIPNGIMSYRVQLSIVAYCVASDCEQVISVTRKPPGFARMKHKPVRMQDSRRKGCVRQPVGV